MLLNAHPRFVAESGGPFNQEQMARLVSENSGLVRHIGLICQPSYPEASQMNVRFINGLSGNTRVRQVNLCLACSLDSEETFRSLVDWLNLRGDKCELHLEIPRRPVGVVDFQPLVTLMERRASILLSYATHLNVKRVLFKSADDEIMLSDVLMTDILSLVTANTKLVLSGPSSGTIRRRVLPQVQGSATLDLELYFGNERPTDLHALFESTLSQRNIGAYLDLGLLSGEAPVFFHVMDCLNLYQRQDGGTILSKLGLGFDESVPVRLGRRFVSALERIPPGIPLELSLGFASDFGANEPDDDEALLQSLLSLPSLTILELGDDDWVDQSRWVSMIRELFHGRLCKFVLQAKISTAHCLTRSFHSSDLQELRLYPFIGSTDELVDVNHVMANVLPTMTRLQYFVLLAGYEPAYERICNEQDHERILTTSSTTSVHLPTYIAYDALYTAVCDHSPSITTCTLPDFTEWHTDRLAFVLKTRSICIEKLLSSNETTPLSLLPLALSRLSEGHWYDVMAYIVRQKSDVLIAPTAVERGTSKDLRNGKSQMC